MSDVRLRRSGELMPRITKSNGEVVEWNGRGMCYCVQCEELFNSEAAFDAHLVRRVVDKDEHDRRRNANFSVAQHDYSHLVRNSRGAFVTGLLPEGVYK